jgi:heme exporter protein D
MIWSSLSDLVGMGGYAPYVWGAYGVTFGVIGWEVILLRSRRRRARDHVRHHTLIYGDRHDTTR